jgi:hypothetical protein
VSKTIAETSAADSIAKMPNFSQSPDMKTGNQAPQNKQHLSSTLSDRPVIPGFTSETLDRDNPQLVPAVREAIRANGFYCLQINPDSAMAPAFFHTVGLEYFAHHPEFVIVGNVTPTVAQEVLLWFKEQVASGYTFKPNEQVHEILGQYSATLGAISTGRAAACLIAADKVLSSDINRPVRGLQIILPDDKGLYPWDDGCAPANLSQLDFDLSEDGSCRRARQKTLN